MHPGEWWLYGVHFVASRPPTASWVRFSVTTARRASSAARCSAGTGRCGKCGCATVGRSVSRLSQGFRGLLARRAPRSGRAPGRVRARSVGQAVAHGIRRPEHRFEYDDLKRIVRAIDPSARDVRYSCDALGRLVRAVSSDQTVRTYADDGHDRLAVAHVDEIAFLGRHIRCRRPCSFPQTGV